MELNDATLIIMLCLVGLVGLLVWMIFRIQAQRKKISRNIDEMSKEIGEIHGSEDGNSGASFSPTIPEGDLLIIMHTGSKGPWKRAIKRYMDEGAPVLVVSPMDPEKVKNGYRKASRIVWLNRSIAVGTPDDVTVVNPTNLPGILDEVKTFFEGGGRRIILMDRFEDVLNTNGIERILRFLNMLRQNCQDTGMSAMVPLNYKAVPQRTRNRINEGFETVVI